jgi:GTP-binding protein EngB required for normal cell division
VADAPARAADVGEALKALETALDKAAVMVDPEALAPFSDVAEQVRRRRGFLGETVVVALAGGTGSGKSSMLNAIAGTEVAQVGAKRPTTDSPLAWIPANPEPGLVRLLDDLDIPARTGHTGSFPHALIDLPDFDSVELAHRATVEALLPRIDAVVWVLDPQKYSDRVIHRHYVAPLADYQDQFLFVLNQADRLAEADLDEVLADLGHTLADDGIANPTILVTAVRPATGDPHGIEAVVGFMQDEFTAKQTAIRKLLIDLDRAGAGVADVAGVGEGKRIDWQPAWNEVQRATVGQLGAMVAGPEVEAVAVRSGVRLAQRHGSGPVGRAGSWLRRSRAGRALGVPSPPEETTRTARRWAGRPGFESVLSRLSGFVTDTSIEVGGAAGAGLRSALTPETIAGELNATVEGALAGAGDPAQPRRARWWSAAAVIQTLLLAAIAVGAVWLWADPTPFERGEWPWAAILAGGGLAASAAVAAAVRASGRRAGRKSFRTYRASVTEELDERIERRLGEPIAARLRAREELAEAIEALHETVAGARRELQPR